MAEGSIWVGKDEHEGVLAQQRKDLKPQCPERDQGLHLACALRVHIADHALNRHDADHQPQLGSKCAVRRERPTRPRLQQQTKLSESVAIGFNPSKAFEGGNWRKN